LDHSTIRVETPPGSKSAVHLGLCQPSAPDPDIFLLAKAGFTPSHYLPGLLWLQLLITLFSLLPTMVLATITARIWQVGVALLLVVLYLIGRVALSEQIPSSSFSSSVADSAQTVLLVATCVGVVLLQYARRKTAASRWLLIGFATVLFLILVATPYQTVVAHRYPHLGEGQQPPVHLTLLPPAKQDAVGWGISEKNVEVQIPLGVSGMADDSIVVVSGVMVAVEAPDGAYWNSGWKSHGITLFQEQKRTQITFDLSKSFFERVKSSPVKARISLALTVYRDGNKRQFVTPRGEFLMPDVGLCVAQKGYSRGIHCRAPLRTPSSLLITSDLSETTCPPLEGESPAKPGEIARDWQRNSDSAPAGFGISPVKEVTFYSRVSGGSSMRMTDGICPGTPLVLSNPEALRQIGTEFEINGLSLSDYRLRSSDDVRFSVK
jgi:hypothetical protein